ncbi:sugar phosphate isomerase/epimerase family protein [Compostibacter hankyongensis]|uniref:Sugar phosphate isomerase/epimerase n=1 Tax=Compostibacter hankyongensis TaxID=1007089 RepID=A0ABP8G2S3_9BACT
MKFGINTFLFSSPFTNGDIGYFSRFKSWGFDTVEIALENLTDIDAHTVAKALSDDGLSCASLCAAMGPGRDLRGTPAEQQTALDYLKGLLDIMPELGCKVLAGPLYSVVGRAEATPPEDYKRQWETVAGHLLTLAEHAEKAGLLLAIEPLNRYETDFINTGAQALRMIREVDSKALTVHLDTFHMNIEEKHPAETILEAGARLGHFHASGSDRGAPGNDHTDWQAIAKALQQVNYTGPVVIESFTPDVKVIARAASIWREIEPSQEALATQGLKFLRSCFPG